MTKLFIWDFDKTFFFTPEMEEGKKTYFDKTGEVWPHKGWWARKETLNMDIFEIPMNQWIHSEYMKYQDENCIHYLVTGRIELMKDDVVKIIQHNNIHFTDIFCNNSGRDTLFFKLDKFAELVEKHKPTELFIYDDREKHLPTFIEKVKFEGVDVNIIDSVKQIKIN